MNLTLRFHGFFCDHFHQLQSWIIATGWSVRDLANDRRRRDRVFLGHLQLSFAVLGCGICYEGELCYSHGDLNNGRPVGSAFASTSPFHVSLIIHTSSERGPKLL